MSVRSFANPPGVDGLIPSDETRQGGRRREELDYAAEHAGGSLYNRNSVMPPAGAGKDPSNPVLVPSGADVRPVGFEDPQTHAIYWFNLRKGPVHYVKQLGLYFKMQELGGGGGGHH